jgi:peroxiredoxin Q/BCP
VFTAVRQVAIRIALPIALLLGVGAAGAEDLEPGARAPEFELLGSDGKTYTLSQFAGKQGVVLAWFPRAFTPGWTQELQALRDSADQLAEFDAAVFMVSLDEPETNRDFGQSLSAKHVLLSDPTKATARAYGVTGFGGLYARRWTFYIDPDGLIRHIDKNVRVESAGQDMAQKLEELGFPRR